jgi:thiol:disulfide interchange protein DsbD
VRHKYLSVLLFLLLTAFHYSQAQILDPCKWSFKVEQTKPEEATLIFTAKLDSGWHLYSQFLSGDGPIPTHFTYDPSTSYKITGKTEEGKPLSEYDKNFDMELKYFEHEAVFKQKINVLSKNDFNVTGTIDYMVCLEQCIFPPPEEFVIKVKGNPKGKDTGAAPVTKPDTQAMAPVVPDTSQQIAKETPSRKKSVGEMLATLEQGCGETTTSGTDISFTGIFFAGVLGGFLALLTPCVFPMIPLTVSFFTKRSKTRKKGIFNAVVYAASIIIIYVLLGLIITVFSAPMR